MYPRSYSGRSRHKPFSAILVLCLIVGVTITMIMVLLCSSDDNENLEAQTHIDSLDMIGLEDDDELWKQEFVDALEGEPKAVKPSEPEDPFHIRSQIKKKQTLFVALKSHELDLSDIHQVIDAMQTVVDFRKTKPGDKYEVQLDANRRIVKFTYEISPEDISIAERDGNTFVARKVDVHKVVEDKWIEGTLKTSLYDAVTALGESGELAGHFMSLFKYNIDFGTASQVGDTFRIYVQRVTLDGKFYRYGRVYAAFYDSRALGKQLEAYYYEDSKDPSLNGYYDAAGRALKRSFLKVPVVGCKMTSPYNLKRMHPILHRVRPHYGIDWAGPTGTHVMAFADGVVTFADWKGANGNLLVIEHPHGYTSLYAHLYAFAPGIKKGVHVKLGQYVAMLGNTGSSTGPHLHFGVKKNGNYIDPLSVDTTHAFALTGRELTAFTAKRDQYLDALKKAQENKPAPTDVEQDVAESLQGSPSPEVQHNAPVPVPDAVLHDQNEVIPDSKTDAGVTER